jgi:SHS2 domain-containing protein
MNMAEFRILEEGAFGDYEFEARAEARTGLFEICGIAAFEAMTDVTVIKPVDEIDFTITAENDLELLYAFLSELIYIKDTENIFFCKFDIEIKEESKLTCKAYGEHIDHSRHPLKTDVKAVTYHKFKFVQTETGFVAHVILDL